MPKVSVLMPVYKTPEAFLREAVQSILNQTFSDFEFPPAPPVALAIISLFT